MSDTPRARSRTPPRNNDRSRRKSKGKGKRSKTPECRQPFTEKDDLGNVEIKVGDKRFYMNDCLLALHSPKLKEKLMPENSGGGGGGGGKGKGKQQSSSPPEKELDWSDKPLVNVITLLEVIDPRVYRDCSNLEDSMRIAPIAKEFQMETVLKECEKNLTTAFYQQRKAKRLPTNDLLQYLEVADSSGFEELNRMCMETCVHSPHLNNNAITASPRLTDQTKITILKGRLDRRRTVSDGSVRPRGETLMSQN